MAESVLMEENRAKRDQESQLEKEKIMQAYTERNDKVGLFSALCKMWFLILSLKAVESLRTKAMAEVERAKAEV